MVLSASRGGSMQFANRTDAGRQLAQRLAYLRDQDPVVLGLPRGGVPVAMQVAEALGARHIILAVPVAPPGWEKRIGSDADEFVALETPKSFFAVGQFYTNFSQT